jgi:hypothetical protein
VEATARPAPPELLAKLSADQRAELDELGALCETAVFQDGEKLAVGCTCCPSRCGPTPDRQPVIAPAGADPITPYARLRGSFTGKGADERLVVMSSCSCAACFDEAYVLRADAGSLAVRVKAAGIRAESGCKLVRRRGQVDRALCEQIMSRMGYSAHILELYDFTGAKEPGAELPASLSFAAVDLTQGSCFPGAFVVSRSLGSWSLKDVDGDGEDDLSVELSVSDGKVTQKMVDKECADGTGQKARDVKLRWTATPGGFKPTAPTAAELKRLDAAQKRALDPAAP